ELLTETTLLFLRRSGAAIRYVVSAAALSVMMTLPAVTAVQIWRSAADVISARTVTADLKVGTMDVGATRIDSAGVQVPVMGHVGRRADRPIRLDSWLPIVVVAWLCGVVVLSLRLISGWLW